MIRPETILINLLRVCVAFTLAAGGCQIAGVYQQHGQKHTADMIGYSALSVATLIVVVPWFWNAAMWLRKAIRSA